MLDFDMLFCLCRSRYTVVINTWKRNDLLKRSISHYSACQGVDAIRIVWSEPNVPTERLRISVENLVSVASRKKDEFISVQFDIHVNDDLNNRFKPLDDLRTDAILSIDDDVLVPCSTLQTAFSVWTSAPHSMVGFVPRMHWVKAKVRISRSLVDYVYPVKSLLCLLWKRKPPGCKFR